MGGCGCDGSPFAFKSTPGRGADGLSVHDFPALLEKGRRKALEMIKHNPAARERVEKAFGIEYCKGRYPEAYGIDRPPVYDEPTNAGGLPMNIPLIEKL